MKKQKRTGKYYILLGALATLLVAPLAFAYEAAPYSVTLQPTFITEKSVQLNGRVNPNEMPDTYEWFEWGIVGRSEVYETAHHRLWGGSMQVNTNASLLGLAPEMQYFYRQVAENGRGRDVGTTAYVTTKSLQLTVQPLAIAKTNDAVFVGETEATLRGYVSPHGNSQTKTWFEWGTTPSMEHRTPARGSWGNSGPIEEKLRSLMPGTLYYFRAVAENEQGRNYGALKVFLTAGAPQSGVSSETPRGQYVPAPVDPSSDNVSRTVTTEGTPAPAASMNGLPQAQNRPGDFFSILFGGRKSADVPAADQHADDSAGMEGNGTEQVAGVGASGGIFGNLWGMLSGTKPVEVVVEKVGPADVSVHTPVEYRIAYAYRLDRPASDAKLKVTLPREVIYIGDNTNNELLLDTGSGHERTYVLLLGRIEKGSTRTLSILGMTTGDATGFPDARVRLEYTDGSGTHVVSAGGGRVSSAKENSASIANMQGQILPHSFLGWIAYIFVVVGLIISIRKGRDYYLRRKESLAAAAEESDAPSQVPRFLPGGEEVTPQGA